MTWNRAKDQWRNYRTYKPCKPVGEPLPADWQNQHFTDQVERHFMPGCRERWGACKSCGYHVCNCPKPLPAHFVLQHATGVVRVHASSTISPGFAYSSTDGSHCVMNPEDYARVYGEALKEGGLVSTGYDANYDANGTPV